MATIYSTGDVVVVLARKGETTAYKTVTLDKNCVSKRVLDYVKEAVTLTYLDRHTFTYHLGYRPTLDLVFEGFSTQAKMDDVVEMCRWTDWLFVKPFSDLPALCFCMQIPEGGVKIDPIGDKVYEQQISVRLVAVNLIPAIPIPDYLYLGHQGARGATGYIGYVNCFANTTIA